MTAENPTQNSTKPTSADGDIVRAALKTHDLTAGATSIDAEHDPACRHCAALAALARLEAAEAQAAEEHEFARKIMFENADEWTGAINKALNEQNTSLTERLIAAEAQRDALAAALRQIAGPMPVGGGITDLRRIARAALAEAGLE